jgi:hypothetical protein
MKSSGPPKGPPKQASPGVSVASTTRGVFDEMGEEIDARKSGSHEPERDVPMGSAIANDLVSSILQNKIEWYNQTTNPRLRKLLKKHLHFEQCQGKHLCSVLRASFHM